MQFLSKIRLSEHKSFDSLGQLICTDCIIARTGPQEYYASELDPNYEGEDKIITINRTEKEVFSPATMASFENVPFVDEHPDEDVNVNTNFKQLSKGFIRDVHRGMDGTTPVLLANLICNDKETIEEIQNGKAELSCGYNCDITEGENPEQINIRGNHVALCEQGRAGNARIIDSQEKGKIKLHKADKPFAVVAEKDFDKNKENCYVEELADTLEDAKYLCRLYNDRKNKNFIVVSCKKGKAEEVDLKDAAIVKYNGYPIFKVGDSYVTKLMYNRQTHDSLAKAKDEIDNFINTSKQMLKDRAIMKKVKAKDALKKVNKKALEEAIWKVIKQKYGEDEDLMDFFVVEVSQVDDDVKVEVRAELGYKSMDLLGKALDPIVQEYSKDSYFEQEESGIMNAWLWDCVLNNIEDSKIHFTKDSDSFKIGDYIKIIKGDNIPKNYICKIIDIKQVVPHGGTNIKGQEYAVSGMNRYIVKDWAGYTYNTYLGNFVMSDEVDFLNQQKDYLVAQYEQLDSIARKVNGKNINIIDKSNGKIVEEDKYCIAKVKASDKVNGYYLDVAVGYPGRHYNIENYTIEVVK